jgi:hypothetical protein
MIAGLLIAGGARAAEVDVTPNNLAGWQPQVIGQPATGSIAFVNGPGTPHCGRGSVQLRVGANGAGAVQLRNVGYNGVRLADLTALSYSTFVVQPGTDRQAPFLILDLDLDGNGTIDDQLIFEPVYQSETYSPNNPQPEVTSGVWQTWDALHGSWWSVNGLAGATPGTGVKPLSAYLAAFPNARIVNSTAGGGLRVAAGFGSPSWNNFVGNVDCVTIGVRGGTTTTYDFEATATTTVQVGNINSGVVNRVIGPGGRTLQEAVNECALGARNHGQFVSCIAQLANDLRKRGLLTENESSQLKNAAAKSNVGKPHG